MGKSGKFRVEMVFTFCGMCFGFSFDKREAVRTAGLASFWAFPGPGQSTFHFALSIPQKWAGQWEDSRSDRFLFVICLRDRRLLRREENHLSPYCIHTFICRNIFKPHCCSKIHRFPFLLRQDHIHPSVHVLLFKKKRNMTTCQVPCHMPLILALGWRI